MTNGMGRGIGAVLYHWTYNDANNNLIRIDTTGGGEKIVL